MVVLLSMRHAWFIIEYAVSQVPLSIFIGLSIWRLISKYSDIFFLRGIMLRLSYLSYLPHTATFLDEVIVLKDKFCCPVTFILGIMGSK